MKTILSKYKEFLKSNNKIIFSSYDELHKWSITEIEDFWLSIVKFFKIEFDKPPSSVYRFDKNFIETLWFTDSKISYSRNVFKNDNLKTPAIKYQDENGDYFEITWNSLKLKTLEFQKILIKNKSQIKNKNNILIVLAWNFYEDIKKNNSDLSNNFINIKELEPNS